MYYNLMKEVLPSSTSESAIIDEKRIETTKTSDERKKKSLTHCGVRRVVQNGDTENITLPAEYRKNYLKGLKLVSIDITPDGRLIITPIDIRKIGELKNIE